MRAICKINLNKFSLHFSRLEKVDPCRLLGGADASRLRRPGRHLRREGQGRLCLVPDVRADWKTGRKGSSGHRSRCALEQDSGKEEMRNVFLKVWVNPGLFFVYFRHFLIPIAISTIQIEKV